MNIEIARSNMIDQQIRPWNVLDMRVLDLMSAIPREDYMPRGYRDLAFADTQIPLGHGQVMLPPREVGRLLQALQVQAEDSILEIGTGSGYLTSLLSKQGKHVLSVELFPDIAEQAQKNCEADDHINMANIKIEVGDASKGWQTESTFDVICITGALPELAAHWQEQLNIGGRLFVVVGKPPVMQAMLITRVGTQEWISEMVYETLLPWLVHAEPTPQFKF